jgi:hypothetical protein
MILPILKNWDVGLNVAADLGSAIGGHRLAKSSKMAIDCEKLDIYTFPHLRVPAIITQSSKQPMLPVAG